MRGIGTSIFAAFILLSTFVRAQETAPQMPVDEETKLITYKEVVKIEGTKPELFNRAIEWIGKNYKNAADVTKVRDPESGLIELIHRIELTYDEKGVNKSGGIVDYTLRIELKDGRYRYTFTNFNLKQASRVPIEKWLDKTDKAYSPSWDHYLFQVDKSVHEIIDSLKKGMQPPVKKKPDEW
ncbi:MAG: DUF4468 domain-containing protein [Bacteroidetes bacterium]|nr:DUF4468 domain-containing protein [Bacteroidota bacterium]